SDDKTFIILRHRNGSVSNISYQPGGDGAFPPERIEMFGGGRTAVLDSWSELQFWQGSRCKRQKDRRDKGHEAEFRAFLSACRTGGSWPISWEELDSVAWATLMAVRSLREGIPFTAERE
ncbi:MAG: alcohol dehydrogenase, partial [Candidatus Acidiferrales bacterium]